ncbi:MAG: hypothetical protein QW220_04595 [Candidatus Bathyarchaeia archaeon]
MRKAPVEASNETVIYIPEKGFVKVGELKSMLAKEVKPRVAAPAFLEIEKAVVKKIIEKGGKVSRSELLKIRNDVKKEKGTKRGVTLARLLKDGFIARIKVPGIRPFYAVTEKGAKESGMVKG